MHDQPLHGLPEGFKCMQVSIIAKISAKKNHRTAKIPAESLLLRPEEDCHRLLTLQKASQSPSLHLLQNKQVLH